MGRTMAKGREGPDHATVRGSLSESLDGTLAGRDRKEIEAHLGTCASCRAFGRSLASTVVLVRQLRRVRLPVPARERLRARLVAAARAPVGV